MSDDDKQPMTEERKKELFQRLEKHIEQQDKAWHAHAIHRAMEMRARTVDKSNSLLVQLVAVHTLREELRMKLYDQEGSSLPDGGDYVLVEELMEIMEGFGGSLAYLVTQMRKEGKA